jgi:hypothetical protein
MLQRLPETIRKSDLLAAAAPAAPAPDSESWESVFQFVERFTRQLKQVEGVFANLTQMQQQQMGPISNPRRQRQSSPSTVANGGADPDPDPDPPEPPDPPDPPDPPQPPQPMKLYAGLLGLLANMPPNMTSGEMLLYCKENKAYIVPLLDNVLKAE